MSRHRLSLEGTWQFYFDPTGQRAVTDIRDWRRAYVPMPWQAQFPDLHESTGIAWYRRSLEIPPEWTGRSMVLHFDAVDYYAQVWINGHYVGAHEGGYLPFEFEIAPLVLPGKLNEITVRVIDPGPDPERFADFPMAEIPHGKQSWYGPVGGIWQPVWVEARHLTHWHPIWITPNPHAGLVQVEARLNSPARPNMEAQLTILDPDGVPVHTSRHSLPPGEERFAWTAPVAEFRWWSPDTPALYTAQLQLIEGGKPVDEVADQFGFRVIETRQGQILLNGEPIYLRSALDQDYYPGTIYTPPSEAFLEDQFRKAKELGLNSLRLHIKVGDPRYYRAADRVGLLIWSEIPNWVLLSEEAKARARATLEGMIQLHWNRPSIIAWSIANESWGLDLVNDESHRAWLREMYHYAKQLDPYRLIVDNSPCPPNFHVQSDLDDYHVYRAMPDHHQQFDEWVEAFSQRAPWSYSPFGDAQRGGQEPLVVSEFGNWGLPDADALSEQGEPWWFETGLEWGEGVVYPHGVQTRFRRYGLDRIFGDYQALVQATQWQQYRALKYEIEAMRRRQSIQGYVITEFTDAHWECNGLLDMDRRPKAFHEVFRRINADDVIIPALDRWAFWEGEPITVRIWLSRYGQPDPGPGVLRWRIEGTSQAGEVPSPALERGQVVELAPIALTAPQVPQGMGGQFTISWEWLDSEGHVIAENESTFTAFSARLRQPVDGIRLWTNDEALREALERIGWSVAAEPDGDALAVVRVIDTAVRDRMRAGGRVLLLAQGPDAIAAPFSRVHIRPRAGTVWQGDWASSFAWLRRDGPYAAIPGGPLLDFSFSRVIPEHVIVGLPPWDSFALSDAGLFVGWIHKPASLISRVAYGAGQALLSTFHMPAEQIGVEPMTTVLLRAMIQRASN